MDTITFKIPSAYDIFCAHLPANHEKIELRHEACAEHMAREINLKGVFQAAAAPNPYGTFTVFKWNKG
jgi:hypothetical protein